MLTHECKGNASYKHLSIKHENIDLYYKNKPRIFATVPYFDYIVNNLIPNLDAFRKDDDLLDKFVLSLKQETKKDEDR